MSSQNSRTTKPTDLFQDLCRQLGECHQNALEELEEKISKLKRDRYLDAQRLEVFYNRNQKLKEQTKALQETIGLLEDRLRAGECDRCAALKDKNSADGNERLIHKLKCERNNLEDENRKLHAELQKLKTSHSETLQAVSSDPDDSIIPDSPVLQSSLPVANRLRKHKSIGNVKHVRYSEMPLKNTSLFNYLRNDPFDAPKNPRGPQVLVPNTCELDTPQIIENTTGEFVAETCGLELRKTETTAGQHRSYPWKNVGHLNPDSTTEKSPSILPVVKRPSQDASVCSTKRRREVCEAQEDDQQGTQRNVERKKEEPNVQPEPVNQTSKHFKDSERLCDIKVQTTQAGTQRRPVKEMLSRDFGSPAFKRPDGTVKERGKQRRTPLQDLDSTRADSDEDERIVRVEPMWSVDPALALSMCEGESADEKKEEHGELVDTDCTWVSHSLLQGRGQHAQDGGDEVSGTGERVNDSLDRMFDTTAYGEYKSCNSPSQLCGDDEEEEEEGNEDFPGNTPGHRKTRHPTFAHVAVVRKKDERRKLKGTTCKECEVYYAHLPEEEKQKKLSSCSRHRFLYIPPCTPENFWEVGFPSTQTCIDRGYIKEDKNPQARSRRRQPFNALFSPKQSL